MTAKPLALIVDDKEENRYYLRTLVAAYGYEVDSAAQGAEALTKARHSPPSLVISDLLMPVMDGYEATRRIKADPGMRAIPVIAVSSYASSGSEGKARQAGCEGYIAKPFSPRQTLARIRHFIG